MLKKIVLLMAVAALAALLTPSELRAYGAAHVGYTHVGPNGVYHTGETVARGPGGGVYAGGRTTAAGSGGGAYHAGYGAAAGGGAAYGGYHYSAGYSGGAAYAGAHYGYVR